MTVPSRGYSPPLQTDGLSQLNADIGKEDELEALKVWADGKSTAVPKIVNGLAWLARLDPKQNDPRVLRFLGQALAGRFDADPGARTKIRERIVQHLKGEGVPQSEWKATASPCPLEALDWLEAGLENKNYAAYKTEYEKREPSAHSSQKPAAGMPPSESTHLAPDPKRETSPTPKTLTASPAEKRKKDDSLRSPQDYESSAAAGFDKWLAENRKTPALNAGKQKETARLDLPPEGENDGNGLFLPGYRVVDPDATSTFVTHTDGGTRPSIRTPEPTSTSSIPSSGPNNGLAPTTNSALNESKNTAGTSAAANPFGSQEWSPATDMISFNPTPWAAADASNTTRGGEKQLASALWQTSWFQSSEQFQKDKVSEEIFSYSAEKLAKELHSLALDRMKEIALGIWEACMKAEWQANRQHRTHKVARWITNFYKGWVDASASKNRPLEKSKIEEIALTAVQSHAITARSDLLEKIRPDRVHVTLALCLREIKFRVDQSQLNELLRCIPDNIPNGIKEIIRGTVSVTYDWTCNPIGRPSSRSGSIASPAKKTSTTPPKKVNRNPPLSTTAISGVHSPSRKDDDTGVTEPRGKPGLGSAPGIQRESKSTSAPVVLAARGGPTDQLDSKVASKNPPDAAGVLSDPTIFHTGSAPGATSSTSSHSAAANASSNSAAQPSATQTPVDLARSIWTQIDGAGRFQFNLESSQSLRGVDVSKLAQQLYKIAGADNMPGIAQGMWDMFMEKDNEHARMLADFYSGWIHSADKSSEKDAIIITDRLLNNFTTTCRNQRRKLINGATNANAIADAQDTLARSRNLFLASLKIIAKTFDKSVRSSIQSLIETTGTIDQADRKRISAALAEADGPQDMQKSS